MPKKILNNWKNGVNLEEWLLNQINNKTFSSIHKFIIDKINEFFRDEKIDDDERELLFEDYYNDIINHGIFNAIRKIRNSKKNWKLTKKSDKIDLWLPMIWYQDRNLLILWKFPWNDTLDQRNNWNWHSYFLNKNNRFWDLLNYLFQGWKRIINNIKDKKFKSLFELQYNFLKKKNIALWDMVHLCYSVYGSAADEDRIPISYSKIWEKLLERLEFDENMDLYIVIWGNRKKWILEYWSMTYLDFIEINNNKLNLSAYFMKKLRKMWAKKIEISETQYNKFLKNQNNEKEKFLKDNVFTVSFKHKSFEKKFNVILWYDSSGSALKRKKRERKETWYNEFFNRQKFFWENFWRNKKSLNKRK